MKNGRKMKDKNIEKEKGKEKGKGFKKFLKICGFVSLGIVGIIGIAFGIALIKGSFKDEKINILALSTSVDNIVCPSAPIKYSGDGSAEVVVMSGDSLTTTLSFTPEKANQTELTVTYINGKSLLKETPAKITAGTPFTLSFVEEVGGGEVEIKFTNSTRLASFTLKVLVDSPVEDENIEFSADEGGFKEMEHTETITSDDGNGGTTTSELKSIRFVTASNPNATKYITLKGVQANTVAPKRGAVVFADSTINTLTYKKPYTIIGTGENCLAILDSQNQVIQNSNGTVYFKYAMRALSSTKDAYICSYVPKTFAMQLDFVDSWLYNALNNNLTDYPYEQVNAFINKYFDYIFPSYGEKSTDEQLLLAFNALSNEDKAGMTFEEYKDVYNNTFNLTSEINGLLQKDENDNFVVITGDGEESQRLCKIMQNIFVYKKQEIIVSDVEVGKINVQPTISYRLFSTTDYNNETVGEGESVSVDYLGVSLISKSATDIDNALLKENIGRIVIAPYVKMINDELDNETGLPLDRNNWKFEKDEAGDDMLTRPILESGPKVTAKDGNQYLQYIRFGENEESFVWYKYDDTRLRLTQSYTLEGYKKLSKWSMTMLQPTITSESLALIYSIESINEDGVASFVYAKSDVQINYNSPSSFGFSNTETKMIYHTSTSVAESALSNTDAYRENGVTLINSITLNRGMVLKNSELSTLEYKKVKFFMVKDTNSYIVNDCEYDIFETDGWQECTLYDMNKEQIKIGEAVSFYDLGENPTLIIKNITSLNSEDLSTKVKIFACIMQTDIDGNIMHIADKDGNLHEVVAHYVSSNVKNIKIDHFATKLYSYRVVRGYYIPASQSIDAWIESLGLSEEEKNTLMEELKDVEDYTETTSENGFTMYISAYPLDRHCRIDESIVKDSENKTYDSDGICTTYLNQAALQNYLSLFNSSIRNSVEYATGEVSPSSDKLQVSEVVKPLNLSNIVFGEDGTKDYIKITLFFTDLADRIDDLKVTMGSNEITLATVDNPLQLDYRIYLIPGSDSSINTGIPYYSLSSENFDSFTVIRIKLVQPIIDTEPKEPEPTPAEPEV